MLVCGIIMTSDKAIKMHLKEAVLIGIGDKQSLSLTTPHLELG